MKAVIRMNEFKFKKKFGQNFLTNKAIIKKIAGVADVKSNSLIIEVGPGSGNLTVMLAELYKDSKILAYEIDNSLDDILSLRFKDFNNIKVLFSDFLKANLNNISKFTSKKCLYFYYFFKELLPCVVSFY